MGTLTKNFNWFEVSKIPPEQLPSNVKTGAKKLADKVLQPSRDLLGLAIHCTSWYRDPVHNASVGGASNSEHLYGIAVDIYVDEKSGLELFEFFVKNFGNILGGIGLYYNEEEKGMFIHVDVRPRINNSITGWYRTASGKYVSPGPKMQSIFKKYNCAWVG